MVIVVVMGVVMVLVMVRPGCVRVYVRSRVYNQWTRAGSYLISSFINFKWGQLLPRLREGLSVGHAKRYNFEFPKKCQPSSRKMIESRVLFKQRHQSTAHNHILTHTPVWTWPVPVFGIIAVPATTRVS